MPQFDIIHNQAVKTLSEDRPVRSGRIPGEMGEPAVIAHWRPRVQAWRQVRKPMQTGIALERRAS